MKFTIPRSALQKELGFVQSVVERKNMIPVLANLLIESIGNNSIRISGTDLDVTIRADVDTDEIQTEGAICVQARKLFDIARLLPEGPVTFTKQENEWVTVESGQAKFKLPGIAKESFPDLPTLKTTPFTIPSSLLKSLIEQTIFAISSEEGRYTLSGAKFELNKSGTKVITTDSHRLALVSTKQTVTRSSDETLDLLVPRKTLAELTKLAADFDGDISLGADDNHIYFRVGTRTIISRLLSGRFPNYEMVLPKNNDQSATFNTAELSKAIRRVALMADDRSHSISLTFEKGKVTIRSKSPEEGEAVETVSADFSGPETTIGFNASYLQDILNVTSTETVIFEFKDANSQIQMRAATTTETIDALQILMPLRI